MTPVWAAACDDALNRLYVATLAVEGAAISSASNPLNSLWNALVGSQPAAAALSSDAIAQRNLYNAMAAKRARIVTDEQAEQFVKDCGQYADVQSTLDTAYYLSAQGGVSDVAGATVADIGAGVSAAVGAVPWVALAVVAVVVLVLVKR